MKLKNGFVVREVAGKTVAVSVGGGTFRGMITLNGTAAFLWDALQSDTNEDALVKKMIAEYEIDEATAKKDVAVFLQKLREAGLLDE